MAIHTERIFTGKILDPLMNRYSHVAQQNIADGLRKDFLPCEEGFTGKNKGKHCSEAFRDDIAEVGLGQAIKNHCNRCPHGTVYAVKALGHSVSKALGDPINITTCEENDGCLNRSDDGESAWGDPY